MRSLKVIAWLGLSIGAAVGGITIWLAYRKQNGRRPQLPSADRWQHLGTLKIINFYPVKGGAPIRLEEVECTELGLHSNGLWERCLVAYDECGAVVFAGSYPRMLSVRPVVVGEKVLRLEAPYMPPIIVDLNELLSEPYQIVEKRKKRNVKRLVECRADHNEWLSRAVLQREHGLRLYVKLKPYPGEKLDISPVMVMHERSVHDLNVRLSGKVKPVDCQQFRGNLVVDSDVHIPPYNEDNWQWLRFGEDIEHAVVMRYNSDCLRCILVNVNVENYTRNADFEPLRMLKKYRLRQNPKEPSMGVYLDVYNCGTLKLGDNIYVNYKNMS
ncbi:mitochondrial amidoxime reducing component 2-like [Zeugodacus cucurbitae]|uniref:mitochondrial amidoxime reducing component 2-like n=1 Tax=Zeugodacus cucurbitae TaxID=28588 RepID=UPI0023D95268|nr:mitochondrial amidoxime reducing component 2-like [Zeugodacus cucurbitae]XP_011187520.2 mitochondrial amidoxime reducing component 2-like [Zeugodacus cucurbitae]